MKKAFTLIELVVSVGILALMLSFASVIFKVSIESHRIAGANAEIMRKFRAITDQLNADFKGLRKDADIFVAWYGDYDTDLGKYMRFDRIFFFANGDFHTYDPAPLIPLGSGEKFVRGNLAWICYSPARRPDGTRAWQFTSPNPDQRELERRSRILARAQHVLTADPTVFFTSYVSPGPGRGMSSRYTATLWKEWGQQYEHEKLSLAEWKNIDIADANDKADIFTAATDVPITGNPVLEWYSGAIIDPADPNDIHKLLCEGVGQFMVQGWSDAQQRWIPEIDLDGDGEAATGWTDFVINPATGDLDKGAFIRVWYPYRSENSLWSGLRIGDGTGQYNSNPVLQTLVNEERFNEIPGLGRALKFTFTLYDSKGIIKDGRTLSHIVYLDN